jgi:hypothetical protein
MASDKASLLKQINQANALHQAVSTSIWKKQKHSSYEKILATRRANREVELKKTKRTLEASRQHLHLNLSIPQKSKRKRISIDQIPPNRKLKKIVKKQTTQSANQPVAAAKFRHRSLGTIKDLQNVSVNPYHSLLTSLVLNKLRQEPQSRRLLRINVARSLVGMVKEETIRELVKKVDLWCAVFASLGIVVPCEKEDDNDDDDDEDEDEKKKKKVPLIVSKLARLGDLDTIRRYYGAQVEEMVAERIWKSCIEWKFPSEVIFKMENGNLTEILNLCGTQLFHQAHDWVWSNSDSSDSSLIRLIENGEFENLEKLYDEVNVQLIRGGNKKIARKVRDKPFAWIWNQSYDWQQSMGVSSDDEDTHRLNVNDGEISRLNSEQDRLLSDVDSHMNAISRLRNVKQKLLAEEEELVWQLWDRIHSDVGNVMKSSSSSSSSSLQMGQRLRWHAPPAAVNNTTAYPVRSLMLSRMRRAGSNDLDGTSLKALRQHDEQQSRRVRMNAVMSMRNIPKEPSTRHTELSNSSQTIDFETLLDQFAVVSGGVSNSSSSVSSSSRVDIPMFRKLSKEEQNKIMDKEEEEDEEEDTSDEKYLKLHSAYLDEMKEKYRVFNEKLKRRDRH